MAGSEETVSWKCPKSLVADLIESLQVAPLRLFSNIPTGNLMDAQNSSGRDLLWASIGWVLL